MIVDAEVYLEHFGKKGMKWGVHTTRTAKETKARGNRQKASTNRRTITDGDLKGYIDRLSNEKKLKTLVDQDLRPGRTIAKQIMSESGQKVARTVVSGAALYGIKVAFDKKFSAREAAGYIAPKPKNK